MDERVLVGVTELLLRVGVCDCVSMRERVAVTVPLGVCETVGVSEGDGVSVGGGVAVSDGVKDGKGDKSPSE